MPWQQLVADVGCEVDENGRLVYREVIVTVPRQSGKTTLTLAWELHRALMWDRPQVIAYTAQTGQDARKKLIEDQVPSFFGSESRPGPFRPFVDRVLRGIADSAVYFKNGSRINVLATSAEAGHGKTLDLGVIDEAFADEDFRREQAMLPAMATRDDAQLLIFSTQGTERSVLLNQKIEAGRRSVVEGRASGIAYFEWSAPDAADPDDKALRYSYMPALGSTIPMAAVDHARQTMPDGEYRRAYMNLPTVSDERIIPAVAWAAVCSDLVEPEPKVFGVDAMPDRSFASIAVADGVAGEIVDRRSGVGWLEARIVELWERWGAPFAIDAYSPAGHLLEPLKAKGVPVIEYGARTYGYACGSFFDKVMDGSMSVRANPLLDDALAGARRRTLGDAWAWARRDAGVDISPLVALTLAFDAASMELPEDTPDPGLVFAVLD